jgi:hypothetical protein
MELLGLYFNFIHDQFHSIFHRPSLEEDVLQGTAPPIILYGIMALSARFVPNLVWIKNHPNRSLRMKESFTFL